MPGFSYNLFNMNKVLIVEASESDRRLMAGLLVKSGYEPIAVESMEAAKEEVMKLPPGAVIVAGLRFSGGTARELVNWLKTENKNFPVIAIVERLGDTDATDVMEDHGAVAVVQRAAIDKRLPELMKKYVRDVEDVIFAKGGLIHRQSKEFCEIERTIRQIAATDVNVVIVGESGMGKEMIALEIYRQSNRFGNALKELEAGSAALVGKDNPESGRSKTYNRIKGYFNDTNGGTIIIKNVHLLDFEKQSVLLHILSEEHPDVRVICTAEPELLEMVREKTFRPTLFYYLRQLDINVPPLRHLKEDIPIIADYYLQGYATDKGEPPKRLSASAIKLLRQHSWPGNIRELKVAVLLAAQNVKGPVINANDLTICQATPIMKETLLLRDENEERRRIEDAMIQAQGNKTLAAKLLGIDRKTLFYKLKNYGMS